MKQQSDYQASGIDVILGAIPDLASAQKASEYIASLRAENERLKAALKPFAEYGALICGQRADHSRSVVELWGRKITFQDLIDADAALNGEPT